LQAVDASSANAATATETRRADIAAMLARLAGGTFAAPERS